MKLLKHETFDIEHESDLYFDRVAAWFLRILFWDGTLPFLVVGSSLVAQLFLHKVIVGVLSFGIPLACAFIREHYAEVQIKRICNGVVPHGRQQFIIFGIVIVLLFEWVTTSLTFAMMQPNPNQPFIEAMTTISVVLYATYLLTVMIALRPYSGDSLPVTDPDEDFDEALEFDAEQLNEI